MKRVHIEPWTTKEKLCLASAVLHSGDQNWMSVSRILRMYGESNRPLDWYSQKQCAVQYECLLNTAGTPKRKKRSEKGVETVDIPEEAIVRKLTQERIEELKMLIAEDKADYLRIKKLQEEVDDGKLDDRLEEVELQLEEEIRKDRERHSLNHIEARKSDGDIASRLVLLSKSFGHTGQDADNNDSSMEVEVKPSPTPTSPLLTSLLQSPSPSLLHRTSSSTPTISSLLHSSPSIPRVHDSPTLSKLLESPSPTQLSSTPVKTKDNAVVKYVPDNIEKETTETHSQSLDQDELTTDVISETIIKPAEDEEVLDVTCPEKKPSVVRRLDLEISPQDSEKEEQSSLNHTQDSDTLEEQLEAEIVLDSKAVDMIVMGPNQSAVIAVHHDNSSEQLEEESITLIKDETSTNEIVKVEECEEITEETVVSINEEDMSKPVEDALKMINDATVVVAESDQAVEVDMPVVEENATAVVEVTGSELKDIVAEEQVVLEEIVTEEIKEDIVEDTQIIKDVLVENTEEEIVLEEPEPNINEKEPISEMKMKIQLQPNIEDAAVNNQQNSEVIPGELIDSVAKVGENEKKRGTKEKLDDIATTIDVKPKKIGRRRKSSKDIIEKESPKVKEVPSVTSPPLRTTLERGQLPSKISTELSVSTQHPVTSLRVKERRKSTLSAKEIPPSTSQKEEELNKPSLSNETSGSLMAKEPLSSTSSVKETPLSLPPPENVVSDFKVPRSDTPSTTDEDNEPIISYISKRGKYKRNSGIDSKPNSPSPQTFDEGSKEFRAWKKSIMLVYNRLSTHKYASIFLRPITNERARGYHTVIHRPMDLSTLKKNIEYGQIRTTVEFQRDVMLMFQNAIMYNNTNTEIFEMASVMQRECIQHFQLMVEAMGEGVPWRESAINSEKATRTRLKGDDLPPSRKRAHNSTSEDSKPVIPAKRKKIQTP